MVERPGWFCVCVGNELQLSLVNSKTALSTLAFPALASHLTSGKALPHLLHLVISTGYVFLPITSLLCSKPSRAPFLTQNKSHKSLRWSRAVLFKMVTTSYIGYWALERWLVRLRNWIFKIIRFIKTFWAIIGRLLSMFRTWVCESTFSNVNLERCKCRLSTFCESAYML